MLTDLPNLLTLLRIASIPVVVLTIALATPIASLIGLSIFIIACVTDYFDGMLARRWHLNSELGRMMDPIADKLLVSAILLTLAGYNRFTNGALFAAIIILLREVLISGLREFMASRGHNLPSTRLAKWKTGIQMIALGFLLGEGTPLELFGLNHVLIARMGAVLLWISVVPTVLSGWTYFTRSLPYLMATPRGTRSEGGRINKA